MRDEIYKNCLFQAFLLLCLAVFVYVSFIVQDSPRRAALRLQNAAIEQAVNEDFTELDALRALEAVGWNFTEEGADDLDALRLKLKEYRRTQSKKYRLPSWMHVRADKQQARVPNSPD